MKRLLALTGLGLALSGCIVIEPPPPPNGSITNVRSQAFYCISPASTTTNFDFKFNVTGGSITGFQVWLSDPDPSDLASTPQQAGNPQGPLAELNNLSAANGRIGRTVVITASNAANNPPILGGFTGSSVQPQAIAVSQGRLWLRPVLSGGGFGSYVKSQDLMTPSGDSATCETPAGSVP